MHNVISSGGVGIGKLSVSSSSLKVNWIIIRAVFFLLDNNLDIETILTFQIIG